VRQAGSDVVVGAVGSATGIWAIRHGEPKVSHRVTMTGLGDVLQSGADLGPATEDPNTSAVRIVRIDHPGERPSWIVVIPGTDFGGSPGDPSNTGANLPLMLAHHSDLTDEIRRTMHDAGIKSDDPVMVSGFSQGGIAAMALACERQEFNITNVVTAGSPVGRFDPPEGVKITSIEHAGDPVPWALDLRDNPHTKDWNTFPAVAGFGFPHDASLYAETARHLEATGKATLPAQFHAEPGSATQFDYQLRRELDATPVIQGIRSAAEQATHTRPMVL
jgi:pimeloyl-ACP methyl ester carboxylesterase